MFLFFLLFMKQFCLLNQCILKNCSLLESKIHVCPSPREESPILCLVLPRYHRKIYLFFMVLKGQLEVF